MSNYRVMLASVFFLCMLLLPAACFANEVTDFERVIDEMKLGSSFEKQEYFYLSEKTNALKKGLPDTDEYIKHKGQLGGIAVEVQVDKNSKISRVQLSVHGKEMHELLPIVLKKFDKPGIEKSNGINRNLLFQGNDYGWHFSTQSAAAEKGASTLFSYYTRPDFFLDFLFESLLEVRYKK